MYFRNPNPNFRNGIIAKICIVTRRLSMIIVREMRKVKTKTIVSIFKRVVEFDFGSDFEFII